MIARIVVLLVSLSVGVSTHAATPKPAHEAPAHNEPEVLPVQGNVYALFGPRGNTIIQTGPIGAMVVDTQPAALSAQVIQAVRQLTPRPIRYIVLTNGTDQNAGGVADIARAGVYVRLIDTMDPRGRDTRAAIMAHFNVLSAMSAAKVPSDHWPTDAYSTPQWSVWSNGEAVQLIHVAAAQTDGDSIVFFRRSDVICAGGIFDATSYPHFDPQHGGSLDGIIEGLNRIIEIAVPGENQEGGTVVVPGRGRLSDQTDVLNYRDMVTIVRDRIQDMISRDMPLEQIKRARPTLDYDGLYDNPEWTADMFVDAVYRDLTRASHDK
jgi:glyoxylase-like metal-dependent hydrolase (beta-lactamase superfamily II)